MLSNSIVKNTITNVRSPLQCDNKKPKYDNLTQKRRNFLNNLVKPLRLPD